MNPKFLLSICLLSIFSLSQTSNNHDTNDYYKKFEQLKRIIHTTNLPTHLCEIQGINQAIVSLKNNLKIAKDSPFGSNFIPLLEKQIKELEAKKEFLERMSNKEHINR